MIMLADGVSDKLDDGRGEKDAEEDSQSVGVCGRFEWVKVD